MRKREGNFLELINPRIPPVLVNSIPGVMRTGGDGFIGGQEATALEMQLGAGFAKVNINDMITRDIDNPMTDDYIDRGAGIGLNLVRNEINMERALELSELEDLKLNDFLAPGETGIQLSPIEQTNRARELQGLKTDIRRLGIKPMTDIEIARAAQIAKNYPINNAFQESVEGEVDNLFNKIRSEAMNGIRNTYDNLSIEQRQLMTGIAANYIFNMGLSAYEIGNDYLIDLLGLRNINEEDIYNTGLKIYDTGKNMYNVLYNWFITKGMKGPARYSGIDGGEEYMYNTEDLKEIEKVLTEQHKIDKEMEAETGNKTPLNNEIKDLKDEVKYAEEKLTYGGTAYEGEERRKYYESKEYKDLVKKLGKLYKDVKDYREGPISRTGHIERYGALTPESQVPLGYNINQRLTKEELKALKKKSKSLRDYYDGTAESKQVLEYPMSHNKLPPQGPVLDVPNSSPVQMEFAVLNPQDIINQMRASKQKKSGKIKQTSILGVEKSTKNSTKAETRLG